MVNRKDFVQELSAHILNGTAVSAHSVCVFSIRRFAHTRLDVRPRHMQIGAPVKNDEKKRSGDAFFQVAHRHGDPVASLDHVCSQLYCICYNAISKRNHSQVVPQQSTQNTAS